jgi:hypothetical protein
MAIVTITITDTEGGGCDITAESVPPPDEHSDDLATDAQTTAALLLKVLDAMSQEAQSEGKGE